MEAIFHNHAKEFLPFYIGNTAEMKNPNLNAYNVLKVTDVQQMGGTTFYRATDGINPRWVDAQDQNWTPTINLGKLNDQQREILGKCTSTGQVYVQVNMEGIAENEPLKSHCNGCGILDIIKEFQEEMLEALQAPTGTTTGKNGHNHGQNGHNTQSEPTGNEAVEEAFAVQVGVIFLNPAKNLETCLAHDWSNYMLAINLATQQPVLLTSFKVGPAKAIDHKGRVYSMKEVYNLTPTNQV